MLTVNPIEICSCPVCNVAKYMECAESSFFMNPCTLLNGLRQQSQVMFEISSPSSMENICLTL